MCCNPAHLFLGNAALNYWDMRNKGRGYVPPVGIGETNANAKLSIQDVRSIFDMHGVGLSFTKIGAHFSIDRRTVSKIIKGERWGIAAQEIREA